MSPVKKTQTGLKNDRFGNRTVMPGDTVQVNLKVSETVTHQPLKIPAIVTRGEKLGPTLFVTSAVHGDEINGVAIVRRLLDDMEGQLECGTLIAVPVVNRFGFEAQSRYLPDRRDLNRHFPGDPNGSMASRIADVLFRKVIAVSDAGIDLHTAASGNSNLCHIRGDAENPALKDLMKAFGTPVMMHTEGPKGALRRAASDYGVPTIIFEAGEPGRFQHHVVELGHAGVLNVMAHLGMIPRRRRDPGFQTLLRKSEWVRADHGGILDMQVEPGDLVRRNQKLGTIHDPFGRDIDAFYAPHAGVIVGTTTLPICNPGMALVHIGHLDKTFNRARDYVARGGDLGHVNFSWQMARRLAKQKRQAAKARDNDIASKLLERVVSTGERARREPVDNPLPKEGAKKATKKVAKPGAKKSVAPAKRATKKRADPATSNAPAPKSVKKKAATSKPEGKRGSKGAAKKATAAGKTKKKAPAKNAASKGDGSV